MPEQIYYYEHKTLGRWWPRTEPREPEVRSVNGGRQVIRGVIPVDPRHAHYSLNALRDLYSRDGRLIYTQGIEHVEKVRSLP